MLITFTLYTVTGNKIIEIQITLTVEITYSMSRLCLHKHELNQTHETMYKKEQTIVLQNLFSL